jgi:hypothetical protein
MGNNDGLTLFFMLAFIVTACYAIAYKRKFEELADKHSGREYSPNYNEIMTMPFIDKVILRWHKWNNRNIHFRRERKRLYVTLEREEL